MKIEEKRALDIKLAIHFLGIKKIHYEEWDTDKIDPMYIPSGKPWRTHRIDAKPIPYFSTFLDACFTGIVPKLKGEYWITFEHPYNKPTIWLASIHFVQGEHDIDGIDETPALAFCHAAEKFIAEKNSHSSENVRR